MKRVLWATMLIVVLSGAALAQVPDTASVGLFADINRSVTTVMWPGAGVTAFTMYVYWLAGAPGIRAVEFMVAYPGNVIGSTVTGHPGITVALGTLSTGMSAAFNMCKEPGTWVASHTQSCFLTGDAQTMIEVVPHPLAGVYQVSSCDSADGWPVKPVKKFTNLCLNQTCQIAVQNASWGAIRSLF